MAEIGSTAVAMRAVQTFLTIPAVFPWLLQPETFHRHAIKFETVSSFNLLFAIFVRGYMMMDQYERLLCYLLGFMACGSHPASVAPGLILYVLAVLRAPRLFGAHLRMQDLDGHIEWHVYAGYITSDTVVNSLAFVYYPVLVWTFYMVSFTHKVVAIRDGCILGEEAPLTVDVFETSDGDHQSTKTRLWWRYSTHKLIADSPMLARSYQFALACAMSTWLNHLVMVDAVLATVRLIDGEGCRSVLQQHLWVVCGLLTALLALISISRRALARASWAHRFRQDLPILFIVGAPCCANTLMNHIVMASCTSFGPDTYILFQLGSQFVVLFQASCFQAIALLVLAHAHPATSLLGSAVCMVLFFVTAVQYGLGAFSLSLLMAGLWIWFPMVIPNLVNDILLVHSVWTAVCRSQANAASVAGFSSRESTGLDVELAARLLSKPRVVLPFADPFQSSFSCSEHGSRNKKRKTNSQNKYLG